MEAITLNNLAIGQKATIITVGGEGILRRRFLDMGLTLRLDDAKKITVQPEEA